MAIIQIAQVHLNPFRNKTAALAAAEEACRMAAGLGADLVALPEMFCCPYAAAEFPAYAEQVGGGDDMTVFGTEFGRIGLCICFDFRFPELARLMALRG